MTKDSFDAVVVGGGAAGIAAARRLHDAGLDCLLVEARDRLGGRAWTVPGPEGSPLDLGCGWLHSADSNPWVGIAERQGVRIDKTAPPWSRPALTKNFPLEDQHAFQAAMGAFFDRLSEAARGPDRPAAVALEPNNRWNGLIGAIMTYITGAELKDCSALDFENYEDSSINWRVEHGYGHLIATHADGVPVALDCPVHAIDHGGHRLRIETAKGALAATQAVITLPSTVIAEGAIRFTPALPGKIDAAAGLPLGLADKLFLSLEGAEEFAPATRVFGRTDRTAMATYHLRPFGRHLIEVYFGGDCARELERGGERAFFDFAARELADIFGSSFGKRLSLAAIHPWASDPLARGSYSCALPGKADGRAVLAAPVDERLFFAGEACSKHDFSTAHGAYRTGVDAAEAILAARGLAGGRPVDCQPA